MPITAQGVGISNGYINTCGHSHGVPTCKTVWSSSGLVMCEM